MCPRRAKVVIEQRYSRSLTTSHYTSALTELDGVVGTCYLVTCTPCENIAWLGVGSALSF